ncbi:hypothetical protein C8J56DRAFT_1024146 [Mycena floridula]|nr:hypothetical protein C8J56DRAFT_1024146 [Mycena floridula]
MSDTTNDNAENLQQNVHKIMWKNSRIFLGIAWPAIVTLLLSSTPIMTLGLLVFIALSFLLIFACLFTISVFATTKFSTNPIFHSLALFIVIYVPFMRISISQFELIEMAFKILIGSPTVLILVGGSVWWLHRQAGLRSSRDDWMEALGFLEIIGIHLF